MEYVAFREMQLLARRHFEYTAWNNTGYDSE